MAGKRDKPANAGGKPPKAKAKARDKAKDKTKDKTKAEAKDKDKTKAPKTTAAPSDFPRGGSKGLTPLELREVVRQAEHDVLFSDGVTNGKAKPGSKRTGAADAVEPRKKKPKKASKAAAAGGGNGGNDDGNDDDDNDDDERASPVERLTAKRLTEGALVFGYVASIRELELRVSLPNGLVGTVPITSVSPELSALVEKAAEGAEDSGDADEGEDGMDVDGKDDPLDLRQRFFVGQFVKCAVAGVSDASSKDSKDGTSAAAPGQRAKATSARIELTLEPEEINRRIDPDDICEGMVLTASVKSVEDRGYVLNAGIPGRRMAAFLPAGEAQAWIDRWMPHIPELRAGQLVEAAVTGVSEDRRSLRLTIDPAAVAQAAVKEPYRTMASAQPGQLVAATVVKAWDRGVSLRFMGFYDCSADLVSVGLPEARDRDEVAQRYAPGATVMARIVYVSLTAAGKVITVSTLPHVLALRPRPAPTGHELPGAARLAGGAAAAAAGDDGDGSSSSSSSDPRGNMWPIPYGTVLDGCTVVGSVGSAGLLLRIEAVDSVCAFASAGQIVEAGEPAPALHKHAGQFRIGTRHRARVIGYDAVDAVVRVSLRPSIVDEQLLTIADVQPGAVVDGTVRRYQEDGVEVTISPTLRGFIFKADLSDAPLKHPELLFAAGKQIRCRVRKVAADRNQILLTARRTLVQSKLPVVTGYTEGEGAVPGAVVHGVVDGTAPGGVFVGFYQGARALAVVAAGATQPAVGKVIKCRILASDPARRRIRATTNVDPAVPLPELLARSAPPGTPAFSTDTSAVAVGQVVGGTVVRAGETSITVLLDGSALRAVLPTGHLSDHGGTIADRVAARIEPGMRLEPLVVIRISAERAFVMVSAKPAVVRAAAAGRIVGSEAEISVGMTLVGWVSRVAGFGAFVAFPGGLSALAPLEQLSDQYTTRPEDSFFVDQTVVACVVEAEDRADGRRIRVSLKGSAARPAATGCIAPADFVLSYFDELEGPAGAPLLAEIGRRADVRVKQRHAYGVIVAPATAGCSGPATAGASGFITAEQAKDAIAECKEDAVVAACVLDVDPDKSIIDYSLRPALVAAAAEADKAKEPSQTKALERAVASQDETQVVVEVVKEDYLIVSLPLLGNAIAFATTKSYNDRSKPFMRFRVGQRLSGTPVRAERNRRTLVLLQPALAAKARPAAGADAAKRPAKDPADPAIGFFEDYQPGLATLARVRGIKGTQANLDLAANVKGRLHITELADEPLPAGLRTPAETFAAAGVRPGETISVRVLGWHDAKVYKFLPITHRASPLRTVIETSIRPSRVAGDAAPSMLTLENVEPGQVLHGFVKGVHEPAGRGGEAAVQVVLSPVLIGHLPILAATGSYAAAKSPARHFFPGAPIEVQVLAVDRESRHVSLAPHGRFVPGVAPPLPAVDRLVRGARVVAAVVAVTSDCLLAHIGVLVRPAAAAKGQAPELLRIQSRIGLFDVADALAADPFAGFSKGQIVEAVVVEDPALGGDPRALKIRLSTRRSVLDPDAAPAGDVADPAIESAADLSVGQVVRGFVKHTSPAGCFVALGHDMCARALISELSDEYVRDVKGAFPPGKLVTAVVTAIDAAANHASLSLRPSKVGTAVGPDGTPKRRLDQVAVGEVLKGTVTRIESYGLFILPDDVFTTGLCYVREIADTAVPADPRTLYEIGDRVLAKVLSTDLAKDRLALGLKSSYFADADAGDDSDADAEEEGESEASQDDDEASEDDGASENSASEDDADGNATDDEAEAEAEAEARPALSVAGGFQWNDEDEEDRSMAQAAESDLGGDASDDDNSDDDDDDDAARAKAKKQSKRGKAQRGTQDITAELSEQAPKSAIDFERLVLGSPSSSFVWIQFMTFYLGQSEVDQARSIAERALKTISAREEQERMNVWMALLNLEHRFGTKDTLADVLRRALQFMNAKHVYLQAAKMHEQAGQTAEAEKMHKAAASKFPESCKVWVLFGLFYLRAGRVAESRDLLARALRALAKRKHVKAITQFGQMEFRHGEPERGRTVFEGVLGTYPRRTDLWSVYLDMEISTVARQGAADPSGRCWAPARALFERVTSMNHAPRKMKFLFKKWLKFEKDHGSEATVERVKERAREYVGSLPAS
ncbi:rRNA biogenesis protein rrp5 [Coemansia javaensis]|uniref:rRNA biogenesis protein rrp5 n=1 Tax=Coemansia javaensis TaxID=2761396 RepID=A0A9W8H9R6_9FUNG|nr:rRNA biogenesis protein rrp5 [Coemansia javaensis]